MRIRKLMAMLLSALMLLSAAAAMAQGGTEDPNQTNLYGYATYNFLGSHIGVSDVESWAYFNSQAPGSVVTLSGRMNYRFFAGDVRDGIVYAYQERLVDQGAETGEINVDDFYSFNTETWTGVKLGECPENLYVIDMAYAGDEDIMYALVLNSDDARHHLMSVNLANGSLTEIMDVTGIASGIVSGLAYLGNGVFMSFDSHTGYSVTFDLDGNVNRLSYVYHTDMYGCNSMTYSAASDTVYASMCYLNGDTESRLFAIDPVTGRGGYIGNIGAGYGTQIMALFTMDEAPDINIPDPEEFNGALNAQGGQLNFHNDPAAPWTVETSGERTYAASGIAGQHGRSASVTANFYGLEAGQTLSFDWKVSSEASYDLLSFYVNGVSQNRISGNAGWTGVSYTVPSDGDYIFKWTYSKDSSVSSGEDRGFIDNIALTGELPDDEPVNPGGPTEFDVALNAEGSDLRFINHLNYPWSVDRTADAGRISAKSSIEGSNDIYTHFYTEINGMEVGTGAQVRMEGLQHVFERPPVILGQQPKNPTLSGITGWETVVYEIPENGDYTFSWRYEKDVEGSDGRDCGWIDNVEVLDDYEPVPTIVPGPSQEDFDAAINAESEIRSFENDAAHPWILDSTESGRISVRSDTAGVAGAETEFTIDMGTIPAGSIVEFDWKVSSETGWDRLCFTVNGITYRVVSGEADWARQSFEVESEGQYVFGWKYEKNYFEDEGQDAGWIDNVKITVPGGPLDTYTVTFVDGVTGGIIGTDEVLPGEPASAPEPPEHDNGIMPYIFMGWDADFSSVDSDMTVTAQYLLLGDVDGNGITNITDATLIIRHIVGLEPLYGDALTAANINGDANINMTDATVLIRAILGLESVL